MGRLDEQIVCPLMLVWCVCVCARVPGFLWNLIWTTHSSRISHSGRVYGKPATSIYCTPLMTPTLVTYTTTKSQSNECTMMAGQERLDGRPFGPNSRNIEVSKLLHTSRFPLHGRSKAWPKETRCFSGWRDVSLPEKERERESECCQLWIDQPPQGEQVLRWEVLETTLPLYLGDDLMMYVWTSVQSVGLIGKRRRRKLNGETAVHLMWDGKLSLMGWFGKGKGTFAGWKRCKKQWRPFNSWAWLIGEVPLLIKRR